MTDDDYEDEDYELLDDEDEDEDEEEDFDEEDEGEVDEMLDALMDEDEDYDERRRRLRGRRRRKRRRRRRRKVPVARGKSAYRRPVSRKYVTQKQFKASLGRVGADIRRNAKGIKSIHGNIRKLGSRVDDVVSVNRVQSRHIGRLQRQAKIDGALELAGSFDGGSVDLIQVFRGAVKLGLLGDTKGALGNPALIGAVALFLRNPQMLAGLVGAPAAGGAATGAGARTGTGTAV